MDVRSKLLIKDSLVLYLVTTTSMGIPARFDDPSRCCQFLAGDVGTQINVSKQFKSGVIAGAFASFTDLSADEFGEGSFTKGFYLSIPFDIMTVKPSNNRANFSWQPLTRDGGQKLGRKYSLIELTDERNPWYQRPNRSDVE